MPATLRTLPIIAAMLAFGLPSGHVSAQSDPDAISWSADRPLVWSDFRGPVDPSAAPNTAATTAVSLNWMYSYRLERGRRRCVFEITEISNDARFHPDDSWAHPEHRTDIILEHEQGHFDLAQVHKLMLDREAAALIGESRNCGHVDATVADVEARVTATVQPVKDRIWGDLQRIQAEYDAATQHGILENVQRQWTARIRDALRRGRWD